MKMSTTKNDPVDGTDTRLAKPPGPVLLGFTVATVLVLILLHYGWWPSPFGKFEWLDRRLYTIVALFVLIAVVLTWAIRSLIVVGVDKRWSWWIVPTPAVIAVAGAAVLLFPPPTFLDKSPEFERVAQDLLKDPGSTSSNIEIGPFDIGTAYSTSFGEVYFEDSDGFLTSSNGWIYSPNGAPKQRDFVTTTPLEGPWYEFTAEWGG